MNPKRLLLVLTTAVLLSACKGNELREIKKEDAVASVNGLYISKKALELLEKDIAERNRGQSLPKEQLIEELVQRELLAREAIQKELNQSAEYLEQLDILKKTLLSQLFLRNYLKLNSVTEDEIKNEYNTKLSVLGDEFKANHILVKTEEEAQKLIVELDKGAKFTDLARKHSLDAATKEQGGDLGWFSSETTVAQFYNAVKSLRNSQISLHPVQTQFGWHVIYRQDSRPAKVLPFDAVKESLRQELTQRKLQQLIDSVRKHAKVELLPASSAIATTPATAAESK